MKKLFGFLNSMEPLWRYSFIALLVLTALDILLWEFFTQTMLFFAVFFLIPAWAIWIWFNPHLEEKREEFKPSVDKRENKRSEFEGFKF
jgi:Flp pilus assembly protein TadB